MKTRRFCPHCGRPVLRSLLKEFAFECNGCNEDFYRFEVLRKKDITLVRKIRQEEIAWMLENISQLKSLKKPYPRPTIWKQQAKIKNGTE